MRDKKFLRGALILSIGGIICKVLGAFYRVPLAGILGDVGMGVYQLIYPIYAFAIVFVTSGLVGALSFVVSRNKKTYGVGQLKKFFWTGLLLSSVFCLLLGVLFIVFSDLFASALGNIQAGAGFVVVGASAVFAGVIASIRGWFQGFEDMTPTAVSQVIEQIIKVGVGIWLAIVLTPRGISWGVAGAFLGVLLGEVVATLYLLVRFAISKKKFEFSKSRRKLSFFSATKILVGKWFAFGVSGLVVPLMVAVDSFLVVNLLGRAGIEQGVATALFGIQSGMINSLINFPMVLAIALSTSIIPSISFLAKQKKTKEVAEKTNLSLKLVLVFTVPCALGMMIIAPNVLTLFYPKLSPDMREVAVVLLLISAFNIIYLGLLQITSSILQALGHVYIPVFSNLFGCFVKIALTLILVPNPNVNIFGSAVAGVVAYLVPCFINIFALRREVRLGIGGAFCGVLVLASVCMAGVTLLLNSILFSRTGLAFCTLLCIAAAVAIYFGVMLGLRAINVSDLKNTKKV